MHHEIDGRHLCDWNDRELRLRAAQLEKAGKYRSGSPECCEAAELLAFLNLRRKCQGWRRGEGSEAVYEASPDQREQALERLRQVVQIVAAERPEGFTVHEVEREMNKGRRVKAWFPSGRTPWGPVSETWQL